MPQGKTIASNEFVLSFQAGEEKGFTWVFNQYYESLCYYAFSINRNKEESRDIVQQIFLNLWQKRESFAEIQSIKSYLYRSVYNKCITHITKEKFKEKTLSTFNFSETDSRLQDEFMIRSEVVSKIFILLEKIPAIFSEIIYLYYLKGKKITDIAEMLNIPIQTVKSRKARGLQSLRKMLPGYFKFLTLLATFPICF